MKEFLSLLLCIVIIFPITVNAISSENGTVILSEETITEDGFTIIDEVIDISQGRSIDKAYTRKKTVYHGDTLIAIIAFTATFRYDGSTVSVVSKSVIQTDTYDGWSYKQNSFTSSGGTVTISGKVTKWLVLNSSFTMGLTCDATGNVSST